MTQSAKAPIVTRSLEVVGVTTMPAESLTFTTLAGAADVGSAAGTVVYGRLAGSPILNKLGDSVGEYNPDSALATSLVFVTGVLDSTKEIGFVDRENLDERLAETAQRVAAGVEGTWACNYLTGLIVVKKKTNGVAQAITSYKVYSNPAEMDASGNLVGALGFSSSAGGGGNTYSTEQGDFTATPTNATFDIVLSVDSLGGVAITDANFANAILKVMDVSLTPDEFKTITLDKFTWTAATKTLDITNCIGAFTLGTGDVVSLTLVGVDKRDDRLNNATITNPIRDISDMHTSETLVDTTNVAAATNYYPDATGLSMAGYSNLSIQGMTGGGVTTTIEATNDDAASPDWLDVTAAFTNIIVNPPAIGASYVNVNFMLVPTLLQTGNFKAFRIKSVTSDATNNVQYNIRRIY